MREGFFKGAEVSTTNSGFSLKVPGFSRRYCDWVGGVGVSSKVPGFRQQRIRVSLQVPGFCRRWCDLVRGVGVSSKMLTVPGFSR